MEVRSSTTIISTITITIADHRGTSIEIVADKASGGAQSGSNCRLQQQPLMDNGNGDCSKSNLPALTW
ncbi:hypothetical protein TYRP_019608 [Tyrophagus putrescentiae]|nr:hypothetical protein TYRP_019608 [Tyrophagus putrescentiae]